MADFPEELRAVARFADECVDDLDDDWLTSDEWKACSWARHALMEIARELTEQARRLEYEADEEAWG